jgi:hypothetical protein
VSATNELEKRVQTIGWQTTLLDVWCAEQEQNGRDVQFVRARVNEMRAIEEALMSSPMASPLAGAEQDTAQKAPDLAAIDEAMSRRPAPDGGLARDKSVRTELAMRVLLSHGRTDGIWDAHFAVEMADALIAQLEARRG